MMNFVTNKNPLLLAAFAICVSATIPVQGAPIPFFEKQVADGTLPAMAKRLPNNPFKVDFKSENKTIGKYGGSLRMLMGKNKDIGQITVYEYARLIGYGPDLKMRADILEAVDVENGRVFTLKIREGHKWSDGHLFTAEDFRYYWEDMINHEELGRSGIPSNMMADGEPPVFEVLNDLTVRFTWKNLTLRSCPLWLARRRFIFTALHIS